MKIIDQNISLIKALCQNHGVEAMYAFGSVASDGFKEGSDVDLVVKFDSVAPIDYADNYFDLKFGLEKLLKREVDLLEEQAIRNSNLRKNIDATKKLVYERGS
ncbi:MAG: nucleotidyltransferase domain-containing protein [Saprospiraceae bacterium]|nr:nucleotidyltransferase domain-containing protein [Saprospiraceae bacterium]